MANPPNYERKRPSRSYSLSRESVDKLDEMATRTHQKRSVVLDNILLNTTVDWYLDLFRDITSEAYHKEAPPMR